MEDGNDSTGFRGFLGHMRYAFESMRKAMDCALEAFDGMTEASKAKGGHSDRMDCAQEDANEWPFGVKHWPLGWKYSDDAPFIKPFDWHVFDWRPKLGDAPFYEKEFPCDKVQNEQTSEIKVISMSADEGAEGSAYANYVMKREPELNLESESEADLRASVTNLRERLEHLESLYELLDEENTRLRKELQDKPCHDIDAYKGRIEELERMLGTWESIYEGMNIAFDMSQGEGCASFEFKKGEPIWDLLWGRESDAFREHVSKVVKKAKGKKE